jgi:hypothetical protein
MTVPQPPQPSMAAVANTAALFESDLRDVAAAVLWVVFAARLDKLVPAASMDQITRALRPTLPELNVGFWIGSPPQPFQQVRGVLYEAVQILELNAMLHCRYVGADTTWEWFYLTRKGRAALMNGTVRSQLIHF